MRSLVEKVRWLIVMVLFSLSVWGCDEHWADKWKNNKAAEPNTNVIVPNVEPVKSLSERKINGSVLMYYDNGQLKAERTYKDSKLNGIYRMYYDNGQLKMEGAYQDDKMDGVFRYYAPDGQAQAQEVYRDNIPISRKILNK